MNNSRNGYQKPLLSFLTAFLTIAFFAILFNQCSPIKNIMLLTRGEVSQNNFQSTFSYEKKWGLMACKVTINNDTFRFILDSGAPCVLAKSTAEQLGLDTLSSIIVRDSKKKKGKEAVTKIKHLRLAGLDFHNIGALILDELDQNYPFKCGEIDGLIGANLMRQAIWQFDFRKERVYISDRRGVLPDSVPAYTYDFTPQAQGTPLIRNSILPGSFYKLDLGADLGIGLEKDQKPTFKESFRGLISDSNISRGMTSFGLYGSQMDTAFYYKVDSWQFGDMRAKPVTFRTGQMAILGLGFFQDYQLTVDWENNEMGLTPYPEQEKGPHKDTKGYYYGFNLMVRDSTTYVGRIFEGSPAGRAGLNVGDTVLKIHSLDGKDLTPQSSCEAFRRYPDSAVKVIRKRGKMLDTLTIP